MTDDNKKYLPYVLCGFQARISSLFLQKLVLFDQQILQSKHLRHYDYECQGLVNLINLIERKNNKNILYAFQAIKNPQPAQQIFEEQVELHSLKQIQQKPFKNNKQGNLKTKFFTRANTSIQQSDNSFIFSPNVKKNTPKAKSEYLNSTFTDGNRSLILQKLLNEVKKVNGESYKQSLKPAKSSYFNLTLGKQSLQTFQNNCNCNCSCHNYTGNCIQQSKQVKRRKILQKFQKIQRKIYDAQPTYDSIYGTQRIDIKHKRSNVVFSVYEPTTLRQRPRQVMYITPKSKKQQYNDFENNFGLLTSKSVVHFNHTKKVFV